MIEILVQRRFAGHKQGEVLSVDENDPLYQNHLAAGNVVILAPAVDELADAALTDDVVADSAPWIHPDEDYELTDPADDAEDPED